MRNCKYKNLYTKVCLKIMIMFIKYILLKYIVLEATEFTFFTLPKHFSFHKICEHVLTLKTCLVTILCSSILDIFCDYVFSTIFCLKH